VKAYDASTGSTWKCDGKYEIIFLLLDGHVDVVTTRSNQRKSRLVSMPFRNYLDLNTGRTGQFSQDSLMNKKARRVK